jgi:NAD(P)H-dependent FMN reductase
VGSADAFLFVTPEYDFFPPASLVNAVQVLIKEWWYKPAGVVSYGGISGGLRAAQGLRQLLGNVNVHALPQTVPVPLFPQFLGEDGQFRPNEEMAAGAKAMLDELHRWALALAPLREPQAADAESRAA